MSQESGYNFNSSGSDHDQNKSNIYLQIATPKSPNSDGFSPTEIHDEEHSLEDEIKQNVINQIDVEILLKHREYNLVQNEISKVQTQLDTLQKLHDDPAYSKYVQNVIDLKDGVKNELNSYNTSTNDSEIITRRHSFYNIRKSGSEEPPKPHRTSYGGLRPVVDSNGNKICVHKRSDGVIVKIECPTCARSDFGSAQGFLNHARLAHQVEYKSQDHAALVCGAILPDIEQDDIGIASIQKLKDMGIDADKNLAPGVFTNGSIGSADEMSGPQKKKARRSISKTGVPSGYLEKLYNKEVSDEGTFKEIYQDATAKTEVDFGDDDPEATTPPISQDSSTLENQQQSKLFKKGHNRRKSRGGLSAVTFDDQIPSTSSEHEVEKLSPRDITTQELIVEEHLNSSASTVRFSENSITFGEVDGLTPAQRRRVPTIPNPLRTRSRSSRENSN